MNFLWSKAKQPLKQPPQLLKNDLEEFSQACTEYAHQTFGQIFESSNTKIIFKDINQKNEKNYKSIVGNFIIETENGKVENFKPELRIYNQPITITSEADIKTTLITDKFMTINVVQNQDYFNVRYQVKPFMIWIWLSVLLISFGGMISFFKKSK